MSARDNIISIRVFVDRIHVAALISCCLESQNDARLLEVKPGNIALSISGLRLSGTYVGIKRIYMVKCTPLEQLLVCAISGYFGKYT